ncbi:DUF763 domain-containing protein [Chitinophaga sancti]|uniref:DUF763 domain-containing protein n=1 Tax=Chitinophaga sancti TaxID=1004 RepID=A0A1K1NEF4_9BACT|nr:DUF763 domain-containing protein [Chitinophaga sancti]WQD63367.1 DUF763 domain-containing protein [Chitinophaga sancti]WQG91007.1 DUF763 domain-containing protein [Chitinophaga sancti]SFW32782.1 hypothetical protein SAMN05661012_01159 [Chitinophaga sancti]
MSRAYADLPLHYGSVPPWLAARMSLLGGAIIETIIADYGKAEVLRRLSDPCWFQALGCVLGMDWHSSGITTSVMGALKKALNPRAHELGIYICGGKGKHSRQTPQELLAIAEKTGLPGQELVRNSKLAAKVDNTALQDGYQLYLHSFIVSNEGDWAVVQQGMNDGNGMARRYHWHSATVRNFTETPHSFIYGKNQGLILNLTDKDAMPTKNGLLELVKVAPSELLPEIRKITMPSHHDVRAENVDLKRLGAVLAVAHERQVLDFETLLLMEGVGPRTLQSLTLVSEVIHGTASRFTDPARFSFAHGGKDGHPFPVPVNVYDETISVMREAVNKAKIGQNDKQEAIRKLSVLSQQVEKDFTPNERFDEVVERERKDSWRHGGRTVFGKEQAPAPPKNRQLSLFD